MRARWQWPRTGLIECAGTCVNTQTDLGNCGACGTPCDSGFVCSAGSCALSCQTGLIECADACVNTQTDIANCGACGTACDPGQVCSVGTCALTCQSGLTDCAGICVNTQTDLANCGACGTPCDSGQVCSSGTCALSCQTGLSECAGKCVDLAIDETNCGSCAKSCAAGHLCKQGQCILSCAPGLIDCSGICANLANDDSNCGTCGKACSPHQQCEDSYCRAVINGPVGPASFELCEPYANPGQKLAVDEARYVYFAAKCGRPLLVSVDGNLSYQVRDQPAAWGAWSHADIAVQTSGPGQVHTAAFPKFDKKLYYARSDDAAVTWAVTAILDAPGADPIPGVSLAVHQQSVYLGYATQTGFVVLHNHAGGVGTFASTEIPSVPILYGEGLFDLLVDDSSGVLWLGSGDPSVRVFKSTDNGLSFAAQAITSSPQSPIWQPQKYSDWAISGGKLFMTSMTKVAFKLVPNPGSGLSEEAYSEHTASQTVPAIAASRAGWVYSARGEDDHTVVLGHPPSSSWPYTTDIWEFGGPAGIAAVEGQSAAVVAYTGWGGLKVAVVSFPSDP